MDGGRRRIMGDGWKGRRRIMGMDGGKESCDGEGEEDHVCMDEVKGSGDGVKGSSEGGRGGGLPSSRNQRSVHIHQTIT